MPRLTEAEIAQAKSIDILSYLERFEPNNLVKVKGKGYCLADNPYFKIHNGKWFCVDKELSGSTALGYLTYICGVEYVEAVKALNEGRVAIASTYASSRSPPRRVLSRTPKPFTLPPAHKDNIRVIAYLQNRGINREIIDQCIRAGTLYEGITTYKNDGNERIFNFHNAVFVGYNDDKEPCFASLRGLNGDFKQDIEGSDKRFSFNLPPEKPGCRSLAVFESAIDAISHHTLCRLEGREEDTWRLSLSGFSPLALVSFLERHTEIEHITLCLDNDDTGREAVDKLITAVYSCDALHGRVLSFKSEPPPIGKDYNDTLQATQKLIREKPSRQQAAISF